MMKPQNDSVATMLVWHQSINKYSKIIEEGIMKFLENNMYEWMKRNTAPTTCKRWITSERQCFVKAISPSDDSGSSSSSNSSAEKKWKFKN